MELDLLDCCDICGEDHNTVMCPELGLSASHIQPQLATRARLTLPPNLEVADNGHGQIGVIAKETIEKRTQFGPFEAKRTTHVFEDAGYFTLKLLGKDGTVVVLDTTDENECNWLCLVRSAVSEDTQNCMAYQLGTNIFYNVTRQIVPGEEVQVWYAPHFAKKLGKPSLPDPSYKVLLGHRIEPVEIEDEHSDTTPLEDTTNNQGQFVRQTSTESATQPRGEIVKVFKCPRCPKEFQTQTSMVQHLRDHVIPNSHPKGRGRPRSTPVKGEHGTPKRKRGRPKRGRADDNHGDSDDDFVENFDSGDESDEEPEADKKPKLGHGDQSEVEVAEAVGADKDYSPVKEVELAKRRVQPRRTSRGQHSKYAKDFVVGKLKVEIKTEVENDNDNEMNGDNKKHTQTDIYIRTKPEVVTKPSGSRGRGRPRKVKVEDVNNDQTKNGAEKESNLPVKIPTKTNDRKANTSLNNENKLPADEKSSQERNRIPHSVEESITDNENNIDGTVPNDTLVVNNNSNNKDANRIEEELESANDLIDEILTHEQNVVDKTSEFSEPLKHAVKEEKTEEEPKVDTVENEMNAEIIHIITGKGNDDNELGPIFETSEEITDDSCEDTKDASQEATENEITKNKVTENDKVFEDKGMENQDNKIDNKIIVIVEKDGDMYKCGICDKIFARLSYLKLHIPKHSEKYKCQKCNKHFTRKETLQKHKCGAVKTLLEESLDEIAKMHVVDGKELYQCMKCDENYDSQIEVIAHYVTHSNENITCLKCNKTLQNGETLEDHNCTANESEDKFPCDLCSQSFTNAKYLHRHLIMHTDLFKCKKCDFCFSRKDSLQKHVMKCCPEFADSYKIHYCSLCYRVFSTKAGKLNHVSKCKWVRCDKCSRVFNGQDDMDSHQCFEGQKPTEGSGIEFSCGKCGKTFLNNYYLKQHQVIHRETFHCGICDKFMKSQEELLPHAKICEMVQKIRAEGRVQCDLCEDVLTRPKDLRMHYQIHTHPYTCIKCNKRFVKESGLLAHSCKSDNSFECQKCYKNFSSSRFLNRHMETDHGKGLFICKDCNKTFNRRIKFQKHICRLEDGTYVNKETSNKMCCSTCGKTFSSRSNLNKHMVAHGEKQFRCLHCGKHFHYENYLRDHISSVHLNLHNYQCTDCGKTMKSKTGLIAHVKQFHRGTNTSYTCEVCGKIFKQKGNLNTHMYSHVSERNFKCQYCHKTFKYPDQLSRHRLVHTMMNKLQCSYCEKKFVKEYELKRHEMIFHSGLVYVCNVCYARCGHKHTLIRHYKRKHPDQVDVLSVPRVLDGMLKRVEDLDGNTIEPLEVENNPLIPNINMINEAGINVLSGTPVMPPQDAAEVLHSLSSAAALMEPQSEHSEPKLEPRVLHIADGAIQTRPTDNQTIQIRLQPNSELQQIQPQPSTIQLSQEHTISTDPSQIQFEVQLADANENSASVSQNIVEENKITEHAENMIALDNGMININGQFIPISNLQAIPQGDLGEGGDGQIVILQILDPQGDDKGPQEQFLQIQTDQGIEQAEHGVVQADQSVIQAGQGVIQAGQGVI